MFSPSRCFLATLVICIWAFVGPNKGNADQNSEFLAIKATLEDYIQGSTNGQPNRLKKAFHQKLNLYSIKNRRLNVWSGKDYIASTKEGKPTGEKGEIISIDFENNTAVAKVEISPPQGRAYVDYFMLLKIDDRWKIVHKMYTRKNGKAGRMESEQLNLLQSDADKKVDESDAASDKKKLNDEDEKLTQKIDKLLSVHSGRNVPGVAVAIIKDGKKVYQKAFGAANLEHQQPINPSKTLFNIASASKHFTGFAVALLAEKGKLSLDDDVRKFIPELPNYGRVITLRHLANHTSGLRSELNLLAMAGWSPGDVIRKRQILHVLKRQKGLNFPTGEKFEYCNSGFTLLAEVVARVSGKPFHQFCREEILVPMGMEHSMFSQGQIVFRPHMAYSYAADSQGHFPMSPNSENPGPGGLWTTCEDMAKWAMNFQTREFGTKKVWKDMLTPGKLINGLSADYSLGLFFEKHNAHNYIHHGGATAGYVSNLGHFPDSKLTIVLLANTSTINSRNLSLQIADMFLREESEKKTSNETEPNVKLKSETLKKYAGRYWNGEDRTASILVDNGSLVYAIDSGPSIRLTAIGETEFELQGVSGPNRLYFEKASNGHLFRIPRSDGSTSVMKSYKPAKPARADLKQYVGKYYSHELDTIYTISLEKDHLRVDHLRFQNVSLIPIIGDHFRNDSWRFTNINFERDEKNKVSGFRIHSLRNRDLKFVRWNAPKNLSVAKTATKLSFEGLDKIAKTMLDQQHLPGLAVVIVEKGKTVFKKGYGFANLEKKTPVDPDKSLFRIGSVSKAMTFLALTRLIEKGQLKRTDNVEKFINNITNPRKFKQPVTVNNLLQHTGGFDQIGANRHIYDHHLSLEARKTKRNGIVKFLESNNLRRVTKPGEMFRYDTYGVTLAGAIIEKVTGKPFALAMRRELFEPLGMNQSFVEVPKNQFNNLAVGYGWRQNSFKSRPYEVYTTTPASSVDMTPHDMGLLMQALTNEGANANGRLFSAETTAKTLAPQFRTHPEFVGITHGMFESFTSSDADSDIHLRTIGHGGNMDGYRCAMTIIPEKKLGFFVIANRSPQSGGGQVDFRPILKHVINQFSDAPKIEKYAVPKNSSLTKEQLAEFQGDYYYGTFCHSPTRKDIAEGAWHRPRARSVTVNDKALMIGDETFLPYDPEDKDVFVQADGSRLVHFGRNSKGKVSHFVYSTSPDTFEKEMPEWPYLQISSLAQKVFEIARDDSRAAVKFLNQNKDSDRYYIREEEFNNAGYQLLQQKKFDVAIEVFKTNTLNFPDSWNAFDSLGEAYLLSGQKKLAVKNYTKSIELNPNNEAGKKQLVRLREEK